MKITVVKRMISFVLAVLFICSAVPIVFAVELEETDDSPFESLEIADLEIIEYTHGYDYGTYYNYDVSGIARIKLTLKDGTTVEQGGYGVFYNGEWYSLSITTDQSEEMPWTAGNTYEATGTIQGLSTVFSITIIESPVESLIIDDMEIIEYTHGNDWGTYYSYSLSDNITFRLGLKDGTVITSSSGNGISYHGIWYSLNITTGQSENPWTAGNTYEATGSIMGRVTVFNVRIIESPVVSLSIPDFEIIVGTGGYFNGAYYYYSALHPVLSVLLDDGNLIVSNSYSALEYDGEWYRLSIETNQSEDNPWTVGNTYEVRGSILGASAVFNVTIVESPVVEIRVMNDLINDIDISANEYGVFYYLDLFGIQVEFNDGTISKWSEKDGITYKGERYDYRELAQIDPSDWHGAGKYYVPIEVCGFTQDVEINVVDNPYWYLQFDYTEKQFSVVFTKTNGQKEERVVTGFDARAGGPGHLEGFLYTSDGRIYKAYFTFSYDEDSHTDYYSKNVQLHIGNMKSNIVDEFEWLEVNQWANHSLLTLSIMNMSSFGAVPFNGYIKGKEYDVDSIISLACQLEDLIWKDDATDDGWYTGRYISVDEIEYAVRKVFGIEDVDITESVNYDQAKPDSLFVRFYGAYGGYSDPKTIRYENGLWIIEDSKILVAVTDDLIIERIEYPGYARKGDSDSDGVVTVGDALTALRVAARLVEATPEVLEICDIDGSGKIEVGDALAILRVAARLADEESLIHGVRV